MELALPITVYWDLSDSEPASAELVRIADEILSVKPLMLQISDPSTQPGDGLRSILRHLHGSTLSATLSARLPFLQFLSENPDALPRVRELQVVVTGSSDLQQLPHVPVLGVSCPVTRDNWRELPELVAACRQREIVRLVLPMQRIYNCEAPFLLSRQEQEELTRSLEQAGGVEGLRMTIHDPFLWRAFNPTAPFPQGGCQAANTMIAISPDRGVYPCPTLPVRLGDLKVQSLGEILVSPVKRAFRQSLLKYPAACDGCAELDACKGGCRGRSFAMKGTFDAIDQACR